ncbi:MAG: class I SAM-dependent methyltransferase [Elusimicrobia bacterium]|nr:class I SAM-dependent methyltransferase [Elusimicrobiota bacterium]
MLKINLGSGARPMDGYINVDVNPNAPKVDKIWDLNEYPWPFKDESADEIVMNQCLEHLNEHNLAMKEVYRILKRRGIAKISVPHFTWQFAFHDPTHKHFFGYNTFFYYAKDCGYFDFKFSSCKVKIIFGKRLSVWNIILEPIFNLMPNVYEQSPLRIFPALKVDAVLIK